MADNNSEILALLAELMRAADRDREENMRRFERLMEVTVKGFGRLESKSDDRRLANTFDRAGQLAETAGGNQLRLFHVEEAQQPTNAELDARLRAVEEQLRHAS